jgi:hypothetical protein
MYDRVATLRARAGVMGLPTPHADGLERPDLLLDCAYVGGIWCDANDGRRLAVTSPPMVRSSAPFPTWANTRRCAVEAAERAFPAWRATLAKERGQTLRHWALRCGNGRFAGGPGSQAGRRDRSAH